VGDEDVSERFYAVTLRTSEYRGDHGADVEIAIEIGQHEPLSSLLDRTLKSETDVLEFRILRRKPEVTT
jgi:hypothetical protein